MISQNSRKVSSYVKARLKHAALDAKLAARMEKLEPLRRRVLRASIECKTREAKLNGGQKAAAERLIQEAKEAGHGQGQG